MSNTPLDPSTMSRRRQILETYKMAREVDPAIRWWMLGSFLIFGGLGFAVFHFVLPGSGAFKMVLTVIGTLLIGLLALMIVFGRRAQKAAFARLEGQLGAAARALTMLRRGWVVEEVVGFTKQQDMVHRVVGPPGIVLVAEGNIARVKPVLISEHKKHERVVGDYPVHDVIVGNEEGQVPLKKLTRHIQKLGRQVKPAEITELRQRLRALDAQRPKAPIPRGPVPTSMKGMRGNLRGR
ncbi:MULTISPECIES: DUF4191 domain-containing protein [unclassified Nocardioides]|jgi:hypothetical protein|uniref:DUF4191 domain-containing protein n=1 Tax=unclassified Nocardioides TaxID=2615069 RepID=UPI0007024BD2|nr:MULTISPECIES: DUF4191 domain-containing protein [unclassified Nocardioides]KRC48910.1 hypothetical protein ASE19_18540 [Nocardioides sp. Root79]KRC75309.1 hypothetical protein ASE20_20440 [Nocardioides sp. Root240]